MSDHRLVLMAVHAHPDDEATGTGGVLARYAAEGIETVLVTCTDGGCGDGPGGVKPGDEGHDVPAVVAMRETELDASCAILGVTHLERLGYADSGMMGWAQNDAPGAFWTAPFDEAVEKLSVLLRRYRPDVVVTYDPNGFYGHPDHIQAHRITMAAVRATGIGSKIYWTTVPRSAMENIGDTLAALGLSWDDEPAQPAGASESNESAGATQPEFEIGLPDDEVTTWVDVTPWAGQKFDALAAHSSQGENIFFLRLGREGFTQLMGVETFFLAHDTTGVSLPEDDLFAGLRKA